MSTLHKFLSGGAVFAVAITAAAPPAHAQEGFERDRNKSVRQRAVEEHQQIGIRAGSFILYPELGLGVEFNDNIYAASTKETSDTIFTVAPSAELKSQWSVHQLNLFGGVKSRNYFDKGDDTTLDWQVGADGRLDVTRDTYFRGNVFTGQLTEPRYTDSGPANLREPVEYDLSRAGGAFVHTFNRIRGTLGIDYANYDYKDGVLTTGVPFDEDFRDRDELEISGRLDYALSPDTSLFGSVAHRNRDYDRKTPNRNSEGWRYLVGANFDLSAKIRGEVGVGYSNSDYDSAAFKTIEGFSANARVEWFPTELTTLTFTGSRDTGDADVNTSQGVENSKLGVRVDHSLRRDLILNAGVDYEKENYRTIDRDDEYRQYFVGGEWFVNRLIVANAGYERREQDSTGAQRNRDFTQNAFTFGIALRR